MSVVFVSHPWLVVIRLALASLLTTVATLVNVRSIVRLTSLLVGLFVVPGVAMAYTYSCGGVYTSQAAANAACAAGYFRCGDYSSGNYYDACAGVGAFVTRGDNIGHGNDWDLVLFGYQASCPSGQAPDANGKCVATTTTSSSTSSTSTTTTTTTTTTANPCPAGISGGAVAYNATLHPSQHNYCLTGCVYNFAGSQSCYTYDADADPRDVFCDVSASVSAGYTCAAANVTSGQSEAGKETASEASTEAIEAAVVAEEAAVAAEQAYSLARDALAAAAAAAGAASAADAALDAAIAANASAGEIATLQASAVAAGNNATTAYNSALAAVASAQSASTAASAAAVVAANETARAVAVAAASGQSSDQSAASTAQIAKQSADGALAQALAAVLGAQAAAEKALAAAQQAAEKAGTPPPAGAGVKCGGTGQPACSMQITDPIGVGKLGDESGRVATAGATSTSTLSGLLDDVAGSFNSSKDDWFSWVWTAPATATCAPFAGTVHGYSISWDLCPTIANIQDVLGWLFALFGCISIYGEIFRQGS